MAIAFDCFITIANGPQIRRVNSQVMSTMMAKIAILLATEVELSVFTELKICTLLLSMA
ncbi:Uncharacterised protein [Vibrio cholerae]|nr:Uncharacterised protein [Vibrio cholerae]CSI96505.1 Uncharacterised protein [Vibrio cholerae]